MWRNPPRPLNPPPPSSAKTSHPTATCHLPSPISPALQVNPSPQVHPSSSIIGSAASSLRPRLFTGLAFFLEGSNETTLSQIYSALEQMILKHGGTVCDTPDDATHIILLGKTGDSSTFTFNDHRPSTPCGDWTARDLVRHYGEDVGGTVRSVAEGSKGKKVLRKDWIIRCVTAGRLVDPETYLMKRSLPVKFPGNNDIAPAPPHPGDDAGYSAQTRAWAVMGMAGASMIPCGTVKEKERNTGSVLSMDLDPPSPNTPTSGEMYSASAETGPKVNVGTAASLPGSKGSLCDRVYRSRNIREVPETARATARALLSSATPNGETDRSGDRCRTACLDLTPLSTGPRLLKKRKSDHVSAKVEALSPNTRENVASSPDRDNEVDRSLNDLEELSDRGSTEVVTGRTSHNHGSRSESRTIRQNSSHRSISSNRQLAVEAELASPTPDPSTIFRNSFGLPLSFGILGTGPIQKRLELLIPEFAGGVIDNVASVTIIIVVLPVGAEHVDVESAWSTAIADAIAAPHRLVLAHTWVDACMTHVRQVDHRPYTLRLEGEKLVLAHRSHTPLSEPTNESTTTGEKVQARSESVKSSSRSTNKSQQINVATPVRTNSTPRKRKAPSPPVNQNPVQVKVEETTQEPHVSSKRVKPIRRSVLVSTRRSARRTSFGSSETDQSHSSSTTLEFRPTTRSALASVVSGPTDVFLETGKADTGRKDKKEKTLWQPKAKPDTADREGYEVMMTSLTEWLNNRAKGLDNKRGWSRRMFLQDLDVKSPMHKKYESLYEKYRHLLVDAVPRLSEIDGKRKRTWAMEPIDSD